MNLLSWLRQKFGKDLSKEQLNSLFLGQASKLAKKGVVDVHIANHLSLQQSLQNFDDESFIVVFKGKKIRKPKELESWFREYMDESRT